MARVSVLSAMLQRSPILRGLVNIHVDQDGAVPQVLLIFYGGRQTVCVSNGEKLYLFRKYIDPSKEVKVVLPKLQDLDVADIEDILDVSGLYKDLDIAQKWEMRKDLINLLNGEPVNYWYQIWLVPAIKVWQKGHTQMNTITDLVTPVDLKTNFDTLRTLLQEKQLLEQNKIELQNRIAQKYAEAVSAGLEQGKNEDAREGQRRTLFSDLYKELDDTVLKLSSNQTGLAIARAEFEYHKLVVSYFDAIKED